MLGDFMEEENNSGVAKGNVKDRLRFRAILNKIAKKQRLKIMSINELKLMNKTKLTLFFYNPIKLLIRPVLKIKKMSVFAGSKCDYNYKVSKENKQIEATVTFKSERKFKKGIGSLEEVIKNNRDTNALPSQNGIPSYYETIEFIKSYGNYDDIKDKYELKYVTPEIIYQTLILRYYSDIIFGEEVSLEEVKAVTNDIINSEKYIDVLNIIDKQEIDSVKNEEDLKNKEELGNEKELKSEEELTNKINNVQERNAKPDRLQEQFERELKLNELALKELNKLLKEQDKSLEDALKQIDEFKEFKNKKYQLVGLEKLISNFLGIGFGLLTIPFSGVRSVALGTNLIRSSVAGIKNNVKLDSKEETVRNYEITPYDIKEHNDWLKSTTFLLNDALENLEDTKIKLKYYFGNDPKYEEYLKRIELLEKGLQSKKITLDQMEEKLEKSKIKVLNRN